MEFTSKQRSYLKGLASNEEAIFQIGKSSITPAMIQAIDDAIEKRELIKISVLKNCMDDPRELAEIVAERTHSNVVIVIGKKIVLYRPNKKQPKIQLPR
jgi:RNA-binding protein